LPEPLLIAGLVVGVMLRQVPRAGDAVPAFGLSTDQALLVAFAVPQVGEFAFVLLAFGRGRRACCPATPSRRRWWRRRHCPWR
jgi:predicted Kef-type K+ transport protein